MGVSQKQSWPCPTPVRRPIAQLPRGREIRFPVSSVLIDSLAFISFGLVNAMANRTQTARNDYRCSMERNQGGKYCVRIQVHYPRHAWTLGVYFLASSFDRAMKKLEEGLDFLQRNEEKLWFWGVDRAEDLGFSAEFLKEAGLRLDRRNEFPRKAASLTVAPEKDVPAFALGPMRRGLAESLEISRAVFAVGD